MDPAPLLLHCHLRISSRLLTKAEMDQPPSIYGEPTTPSAVRDRGGAMLGLAVPLLRQQVRTHSRQNEVSMGAEVLRKEEGRIQAGL